MLHLNSIDKIFNEGTQDEKIALNDIQLTLARGDFVTVIGSNGAGKSTLLSVISGALIADRGEIAINGNPVTTMPEFQRARFIGRVFQDPMLGTAPTMTIEENLAMAYFRNKKRTLAMGVTKMRRLQFKDYLQTLQLGLENRLNTKVGKLSGGERQALSLLMATFTEPDILLLDEHTAALDPAKAAVVTQLTKKIVNQFHLTTLMVTHNMQQALDLGNRLIMMDKGQIILDVNESGKKQLTIDKLLLEFQRIRGIKMANDRALLQDSGVL